jgi:hypothetical protein
MYCIDDFENKRDEYIENTSNIHIVSNANKINLEYLWIDNIMEIYSIMSWFTKNLFRYKYL